MNALDLLRLFLTAVTFLLGVVAALVFVLAAAFDETPTCREGTVLHALSNCQPGTERPPFSRWLSS